LNLFIDDGNEIVGEFIYNIIGNDTVIVELKSARQIMKEHEVQLVNYLVAKGKSIGLINNFGKIKRQVRDLEYEIYRILKISSSSCYPV